MRAGYIYFAETSAAYIKVGRCYSHVTIAQKEAMYRRLDPGFIIRHAYACDDVVVEEKRVLNMLRLVAGTEVKGAGRECFAMGVKEAVAAVTAPASSQDGLARKLVLEHVVSGRSVRELIAASDLSPEARAKDSLASVTAYTTSMLALGKLGIMLVRGGKDIGLSADAYATVVDGKLLARRIPKLKTLAVELSGLALY
jgi:hypothetical protein